MVKLPVFLILAWGIRGKCVDLALFGSDVDPGCTNLRLPHLTHGGYRGGINANILQKLSIDALITLCIEDRESKLLCEDLGRVK